MNTDAGNDTNRPRGFRSRLVNAASSQVNEQKHRLATRAAEVLHAVRQTAEQLRDPSPAVADYVERAADRIDEWVTALRDRDAAELLEEVRDFARERPALIIGGGFALGLLAARFLKSSGHADEGDAHQYDYASEGSLT